MKKLFKLNLFFLFLTLSLYARAQCTGISFSFDEDSIVQCGGDSISITAIGQGTVVFAIDNDFNTGNAGSGWAASPAASFNNPCGNGPGNSTDPYLWMGSSTAAPRTLQTYPLDLTCGAELCFDFRMAEQSDPSPCEGPDVSNEGIYIEWSSNGGSTWNLLNYFEPNSSGSFNAACAGCGDYTGWHNYCYTLPAAALTPNTSIRWYQGGSTGTDYDHWGLDNIVLTSYSCSQYYYDWAHLSGTPDTNTIDEFVATQTTYSVIYTNGIDDTCSAMVTVYVDTVFDVSSISTSEYCSEDDDGMIIVTPEGGYSPYNYLADGPNSASNAAGTFTNLADGEYLITVMDNSGCVGLDTVFLEEGFTLTGSVTTYPAECYGDLGKLAFVPDTGQTPYTYVVEQNNDTIVNTVANFFLNQWITSGTYTMTVTDGAGCSFDTIVTIASPPQIIPNFSPSVYYGVYPLPVSFTNNTAGATNFYWDFGDGNSSTAYNPDHTFDSSGEYLVTLTATEGPCSQSSSVLITVTEESSIHVPNIITPNDDGVNDSFTVEAVFIETYYFAVYNRWGKKLWETSDPTQSWNGTNKSGNDVSDGAYFYVIEAQGIDGVEHQLSGIIQVVR